MQSDLCLRRFFIFIADTTWLLSEKWYTPVVVWLIIQYGRWWKSDTIWLFEKGCNLVVVLKWYGVAFVWRRLLEVWAGHIDVVLCWVACIDQQAIHRMRNVPCGDGGCSRQSLVVQSSVCHERSTQQTLGRYLRYLWVRKSFAQKALCSCVAAVCVRLRHVPWWWDFVVLELVYFTDVPHDSSCLGVSVFYRRSTR